MFRAQVYNMGAVIVTAIIVGSNRELESTRLTSGDLNFTRTFNMYATEAHFLSGVLNSKFLMHSRSRVGIRLVCRSSGFKVMANETTQI